jgi:hypothetical protein
MSLLHPLTRLIRFQKIWNLGVFLLVTGAVLSCLPSPGERSDILTLRLNESRCLARWIMAWRMVAQHGGDPLRALAARPRISSVSYPGVDD